MELSGLNTEQKILTERKFRNFILGGAAFKEEERERFREISEELATLSLKFEENVLEETNSFELHITDNDDLAGLPESLIEMASMEAERRKKRDGSSLFISQAMYPLCNTLKKETFVRRC